MKVVLVHNTYQQPGGEDVVFAQEKRLLEQRGHSVLTYSRSNFDADSYTGLRQLQLAKRTIWNSETHRDFANLLGSAKPDLVHVHNTFMMISPSIYWACRELDVPVVQTLHNFRLFCPAGTFFRDGHVCEECVDHGLLRSVRYRCYRDSTAATAATALMLAVHRKAKTWTRAIDSYICLTQFSRSRCVRGGLPEEKVFVKPNFVDPDPGLGTGPKDYAIFAGRLSPTHRVTTILDALHRLVQQGMQIPVWIVGGGPERPELEAYAQRLKLSNVTFKGQLPRSEAISAIRGARSLLFTSQWYENFPLTIIESFACGVPVLCSRVGAMQEIVEDGHNGLHFNAGDSQDLAAKLAWSWNHPDRMSAMGQVARKTYEANYTPEENYKLLMSIYKQVLSRRGISSENCCDELALSTMEEQN